MSVKRKFSSGVFWMSAGSWIEQSVNFLIFAALARILGVETFGILAMAAAFVLVPEFLVRESISEILLTRDELSPKRLNSVFWSLAGFGALLTVGLLLASGLIAEFYRFDEIKPLIIALSPTVMMISLTAVPVALLRRELKFRVLALRAVAGVVAGGAVGIGMAVAGYGVWSLVGQRIAQVGVNIAMAWLAVDWRPGREISRNQLREVWKFGHSVAGLRAAELVAVQMPAVMIGVLMGPASAGLYSIAWRIVEIASFLVATPLRMAAQPAFSAVSREGGGASGLLVEIMRLSGIIAFPAFAGLAILSKPTLIVLFGLKWVPAAPILSALSIFGIYLCIEKVQQTYCLSAGKVKTLAKISWFEVFFSALLMYLTIPYGLTIATVSFVAAFLLVWPLKFQNLARISKLKSFDLAVIHVAPAAVTIVMVCVIWIFVKTTEDQLGLMVLPAATVGGLFIFLGFSKLFLNERLNLVKSFISSNPTNRTKTSTE